MWEVSSYKARFPRAPTPSSQRLNSFSLLTSEHDASTGPAVQDMLTLKREGISQAVKTMEIFLI